MLSSTVQSQQPHNLIPNNPQFLSAHALLSLHSTMACSVKSLLVLGPSSRHHYTTSFASSSVNIYPRFDTNVEKTKKKKTNRRSLMVQMVQQTVPQGAGAGASAIYAKEMERLSAKESLLLAFKDAGGFEALVNGRVTDMQRIDVNERIVGLERLNPTPRPTTSPFLEGRWNFQWFGTGSAGFFAAKLLLERFPPELANLGKMDVLIKDGYANISANVKLLNSIENYFSLLTKLTIEGPLRMAEEYIEGTLEFPKIREETIPEQLKGAIERAVSTLQQLPAPIRDVMSNSLKVPLGGTYQRIFMISYLDEEILVRFICFLYVP
ncbi:hypothetical protein Leryth_008754 [Lithospermum erythrorhizon]|nr:hypothetical protein Leryth_008754 [Lithospermum erythrorhizon]